MKNIINGIDVSECEKLGETIDGFTCGLGKRIRFADEIITKHNLCKDNPDCYFKKLRRLQEENEKLKNKNNDLIEEIASGNIDITILQKENEELKEKIKSEKYIKENALQETTKYSMKCVEFRQALEEIRKEANRLLFEENPIYGYNNSNYFEILVKYVLAKTDEVLNERYR